MAANLLEKRDTVFHYAGDERLAIAQVILYGASAWTVQVLHIVPMTAAQQPILSVILEPPALRSDDGECEAAEPPRRSGPMEVVTCKERAPFTWSWRIRSGAPGEAPRIEIGPRAADGDLARVAATYRLDPRGDRYVGPDGGVREGFLRLSTAPGVEACEQSGIWARHFVRVPREMEKPLPLRVAHRVQRSLDGLDMDEPRWPTPQKRHPRLVISTRGPCPLRVIRFAHDAWTARLTPPALKTAIPLDALRHMSEDDLIEVQIEDTCGGSLSGSFPVP
jgi:hypothetical protein